MTPQEQAEKLARDYWSSKHGCPCDACGKSTRQEADELLKQIPLAALKAKGISP